MILSLTLHYRARFGENLFVNFDNGDRKSFAMKWTEGHQWTCNIDVSDIFSGTKYPADNKFLLSYFYSVGDGNATYRSEWHLRRHCLNIKSDSKAHIKCYDLWHDKPHESYFYTQPFTCCWNATAHTQHNHYFTFNSQKAYILVAVPQYLPHHRLFIVGSTADFGSWQTDKAIALKQLTATLWYAPVSLKKQLQTIEFKCIAVDTESPGDLLWQEGDNHTLSLAADEQSDGLVFDIGEAHFPLEKPHFSGTLIPLFSLRSEGSFGIGDFGDLTKMIDWMHLTHQSILQLLPINDTTLTHDWHDSYPYSPVSVFALHPQYIDLRQLPQLRKKALQEQFETKRQQLNKLPTVDYVMVNAEKMSYLAEIYRQEKSRMAKSKAYRSFCQEQSSWLDAYAEYCLQRDNHQYAADFYRFLQYIADLQMRKAHDYAQKRGIALKGDIPIGVNINGCDVAQHPNYFNKEYQTGAPPDKFAVEGQNWDFPTYAWQTMAAADYDWWRHRLNYMARYFDAYRIDHILGFFRIWEIPRSSSKACDGQFSPAIGYSLDELKRYFSEEEIVKLFLEDHREADNLHPRINAQSLDAFQNLSTDRQRHFDDLFNQHFFRRSLLLWRKEAMDKLPAIISATDMLACGEDLGMVPDCVAEVMKNLEILSLEVETMPKELGREVAEIDKYPYCSVTVFATHDMPTMRQWWSNPTSNANEYFAKCLGGKGKKNDDLTADTARAIIERQVKSPSMLTILTLQDWLAMSKTLRNDNIENEQINVPANPNHHWCYRMHITLEQLFRAKKFNKDITSIISNAR